MSLTHIDHIAIETSDVGRAVKWYREKFRCEVKYQDQSWALILFNNVSLALVTPGQHPPHFAVVDGSVKKIKVVKFIGMVFITCMNKIPIKIL